MTMNLQEMLTQLAQWFNDPLERMLVPSFGGKPLHNLEGKVTLGPEVNAAYISAIILDDRNKPLIGLKLVLRFTEPPEDMELFQLDERYFSKDALDFLQHFFVCDCFFHDAEETAFCVRAGDLVPGLPGFVSVTLITKLIGDSKSNHHAIAQHQRPSKQERRAAIAEEVMKRKLEERISRMHLRGFSSLEEMDKADTEDRARQLAEQEEKRKIAEEERRRVLDAKRLEREQQERADLLASKAKKAEEAAARKAAKEAAEAAQQLQKFGSKRGSPPPGSGSSRGLSASPPPAYGGRAK